MYPFEPIGPNLSIGQRVYFTDKPARVTAFPFLEDVRIKFDSDGREITVAAREISTTRY